MCALLWLFAFGLLEASDGGGGGGVAVRDLERLGWKLPRPLQATGGRVSAPTSSAVTRTGREQCGNAALCVAWIFLLMYIEWMY